jgi:nitroreductase
LDSASLRYHEATKHHFNRFARALGYLDWATQPDPFRRYAGAPLVELPREPLATDVPYSALYDPDSRTPPRPLDAHSIGEFLRCSMGLSAWKQYGTSRWALRVNPSSGNLHPTETYVIWNGRVCHYAVKEHALEERCVLLAPVPRPLPPSFFVALTSIHWREAWKYGERAFRYCQHDAGHAIAALRLAAALLGWQLTLLPQWSDAQIAALLGLDRDADFGTAEREEAECIALVTAGDVGPWRDDDPTLFVDAARNGTWSGRANTLSSSRIEWPIIDEIAAATRYPGPGSGDAPGRTDTLSPRTDALSPRTDALPPRTDALPHRTDTLSHRTDVSSLNGTDDARAATARHILLQRRSALAFNPQGFLTRSSFLSMLRRLHPGAPPWDAIDWPPRVHLALFVHRVQDTEPGLYAYLRDGAVLDEWKTAMRAEFLWERVDEDLFLLVPIDCRRAANRVSCDQEIAEDGFFSLGMIARLERPVRDSGEWVYRRLFWECGIIGQILYLEAEAVGGRATGIGCFYDDPVHDALGLSGHAWQSLYHFSMGIPVEDTRLTTEPGYGWEAAHDISVR